MLITIVDTIDINDAYDFLRSNETGAINLFVGTVRNQTKGKEVVKLVFEAYEPMAIKEMMNLAEKAKRKWPINKVVMIHAVGEKKPGEAVVVIGVNSAHRAASFDACEFFDR